ncbi:hypothetical protein GobsT_48180 [Gemmata obscuriglobus]|uniref:Uncharacterized protein n=1 Tax=Gemmata obscuriglobus TaxID=114 RepID=A0A2Z3GVB0_9BACT|nr:hypothetical protein [Gemmata obscuriglobus]AWM37238.1 hypothetical protein C1280_09515 [Gemmata obscuriglobus]QEG30018.1 hypothetical protein GobsT_48180 [Gemmata obscuriglobus]VTS09339.1 unnamed protein product [Gemmata obscuriglobus UQM 2246]
MRIFIAVAALTISCVTRGVYADVPREFSAEALLLPTPPQEVAAGTFEQCQREVAEKPGTITYSRVEYDKKVFWVIDTHTGIGNSYKKVAVYSPKKDGTFRRCLLADLEGVVHLAVAVDPRTGMLELREQANSPLKGAVILSFNLNVAGTGMSP